MTDRFDEMAKSILKILDGAQRSTHQDILAEHLRSAHAMGGSEERSAPSGRRVRTALRRAQRMAADAAALEEIVHALCVDRAEVRAGYRAWAQYMVESRDIALARAAAAEAAWDEGAARGLDALPEDATLTSDIVLGLYSQNPYRSGCLDAQQRYQQTISIAYGNLKTEDPSVTREQVEEAYRSVEE